MKLKHRQNSQAGFNLVEAAIVLGIVGLVVGGIWAAASSAYEGMRQQAMSRNVLALVQNIKNFYSGAAAPALPSKEAEIIATGVVPRELIVNGAIVHPWGSAKNTITLAGSAPNFTITFGAPSAGYSGEEWAKTCNTLISRIVNAAGSSSGVQWAVDGKTFNSTVSGTPGCAKDTAPILRFPFQ